MKKIALYMVLGLLVVSMFGMASAVQSCSTIDVGTVINGKILNDATGVPISGANVKVSCNGKDLPTTSGSGGEYSVLFSPSQCGMNDTVVVSADNGEGLIGQESGIVDESGSTSAESCPNCCLEFVFNVGCIDVRMVPEFGIAMGIVTLVSAVGLFFFIRR
jgi:hypothetical protein